MKNAIQEIDIIYLYEHVARELDVACAVKAIAERHFGIRIELVHFPSGLPRAFRQFRPRIVVLSHCYSAANFDTILLEWRKSLFLNLSWEQLLSEAHRKEKAPSDEFSRKHVIHQAWSDSFASFLEEQGIPSENIFVNGQPAYMLYKEPYRRYFKERRTLAIEHNLDAKRRWIFFPENFGRAFFTDEEIAMLESQGHDRERAYTMKHFARQTMRTTMKWCAALAKHNEIELIIRPRPATPLQDFLNAVQESVGIIPERMHFIKNDSVREWIMASDIVISSYSTSLIEAAIAGKSVYMLVPSPTPDFLHVGWHNHIDHIRASNEFTKICLNSSVAIDNNQLDSWAQNLILSRGDAIWNLARFLARLCNGQVKCPSLPNRKTVTKAGRLGLPKWALFEYRRIRYNRKRRNQIIKDFVRRENDHLSQLDVLKKANDWKRILSHYDYCMNEQDEV